MGKTKKTKSKKNNSYRPLSDSFCRSIVNKSQGKDKYQNKSSTELIIYNTDKSAYMKRIYDGLSMKPVGIEVVSKEGNHTIKVGQTKNTLFETIVELIHFGFTYNQIYQLLRISKKDFESCCTKDYKSMEDMIFFISCVPQKYVKCNDIMHFIKGIPEYFIKYSDLNFISELSGISVENLEKCKELYEKKYRQFYTEIKNNLKKKEEDEMAKRKREKAVIQNNKPISVMNMNKITPLAAPLNQSPFRDLSEIMASVSSPTNFQSIPMLLKDKNGEIENKGLEKNYLDTSKLKITFPSKQENNKSEPIIDTSTQVDDVKDIIETEENTKVNEVDVIEEDKEPEIINSIMEENSEKDVVGLDREFDNMENSLEKNTEKIKSVRNQRVDIEEYQKLLGFSGIPFDFNFLSENLKEGLKEQDFSDYIEKEQKEGISNLLYVLMMLNNCQSYNTPFYPAEDKILETYYKEVGYRVVDIIKAVIPNYQVRPNREYLTRIRERKYKTPHPMMGFDSWDNDISLIRSLYPKVKKGPTKYFFWLDSFDLLYIVEKEGLGQNSSKKVKEIIDLGSIDLKPYIASASKMKEVLYHSDLWTSDRHDIFKNEFKNVGLDIVGMIDGVTIEECKEHSLKYKIYQNYTTKEVEKMKEVYLESGLEGLYKEFSYRTEEALKFKVEEQGWDKLVLIPTVSEEELQKKVNEKFEAQKEDFIKDLRIQYIDEFYKEEVELVKMELEESLRPLIKKEVIEEISKIMTGVYQEMKLIMPDMVKKSNIKDLPNVLPQKISAQLESFVKSELNKI